MSVESQATGTFGFRPGPIMAQIVLTDEINRATPKTQSALLEAMEEHQVTIDGVTHPLPRPFMVMATQNPLEYEGTFPPPEAQPQRLIMLLHRGHAASARTLPAGDGAGRQRLIWSALALFGALAWLWALPAA